MGISKKWLVLPFLLLLMAGCCSVPKLYRPVAEFQRKHPKEFKKYAYLNPVYLDTYRGVYGFSQGSASYSLGEINRRFGNNASLKEFIQKITKQDAETRQKIIESFDDLEKASSNGGVICQYE
jgi:hypothetical protein